MDLQRGRPVLVRILSAALAANEGLWSQLVARAQQVSAVEHPGLLRPLSVGRDEGIAYLVQDYIEARPLADAQAGKPKLAREQALFYGRQVASALDALHAAGVAHGAVCPAAVLEDTNTGALLLDGMAAASLQGASEAMRTAAASYAAPEQISSQMPSAAADRYALAAMMFEWLTGQHPHAARGQDLSISYSQWATMAPPSATAIDSTLPRALDKVFADLLSPRPSGRPQTALAVVDRVEQAMKGRGVAEGKPSWVWSVAGSVAALLLIAGAVWAVASHGGWNGFVSRIGGGEKATVTPTLASPMGLLSTPTPQPLLTATPPTTATRIETSVPVTEQPTATAAISNTPVSATTVISNTPTSTATMTEAPTPTPKTTPTTGACSIVASGAFATLAQSVKATLGCPLQAEAVGGYWAYEPFEHGAMYWSQDADIFLVLIGTDSGDWVSYPDDATAWQEGQPEKTCDPDAPEGLKHPIRGFGKIWCTDDDVRARLGWATDTEEAVNDGSMLVQRFERGYILRDQHGAAIGQAYVLAGDTGTWERMPY